MKQRLKILFSLVILLSFTLHGFAEENNYTLKYYKNSDGTFGVGGYSGTPVDVIVPEATEVGGRVYKITSIGYQAFMKCSSLKSIKLPEGMTSMGNEVFSGCSSLTRVELPSRLAEIGQNAFSNCTSLTTVVFPVELTSIQHYAFYGCTSLTSIELPSGLSEIGACAFSRCTSLTSIVMPSELTSIKEMAFKGCVALSSIELSDGITSIGENAFGDCISLTSVTLPISLTTIACDVFKGCTSLSSINLPNELISIDAGAFTGCCSLISIELPKGLTSIGDLIASSGESGVFEGCSSLKSIELPRKLTLIDRASFKDCSGLEVVRYLTSDPIYADENIFSVYDTAILEIPKGTREAFMATTPWNLFKNIVEVDEDDPFPTPSFDAHLLTVNVKNGFTAKLKVNHGEKAVVALDLDEWWEPGEVHFNDEPMTVGGTEFETPEITEPATLRITPRFKGDVQVLDYATGKVELEGKTLTVYSVFPDEIVIEGLEIGDEIAVYTVAGHLIRSATACNTELTITGLPEEATYIVRVNSSAFKIAL